MLGIRGECREVQSQSKSDKCVSQIALGTNDNSKGFSLIETLIAIGVLAVALLGLAQLTVVALDTYEFSEYNSKATGIAQAKIEQLRALFNAELDTGMPIESLAEGSYGPETVTLRVPEETSQNFQKFRLFWNISRASGGARLITVQVVPFDDIALKNKVITMTAYFAP